MENRLGPFLKGLRQRRQQSLRWVAARAGVSPSTVGNWEAGRTLPRVPELTAVLEVLKADSSQRQRAFVLVDTPRTGVHLREMISNLHPYENGMVLPVPSGGDLLRAMRLRRGLTLDQVAAVLKVRASAVTRWEQSRALPSETHREAVFSLLGALPEERSAFGTGLYSDPSEESLTLDSLTLRFDRLRKETATGQHCLVDLRFLALEADLWHLAYREPSDAVWRALGLTYTWHAQWLLWRERMSEAGRCARQALSIVQRYGKPEPFWIRAVTVAANNMVDGTSRPRLSEGIEFLRRWLPVCRWPESSAWVCQNIATFAMRSGQIDYALEMDSRAVRLVEGGGNPRAIRNTRFDSAVIHLRKGNPDQAHSLLSSDAQPNAYHQIYEAQMWTETLLALGEKEQAYNWLCQTYVILKQHGLSSQYAEPFAHWAVRWRSLF